MFTVNEGVMNDAAIKNLVDLRVLSALVVNLSYAFRDRPPRLANAI